MSLLTLARSAFSHKDLRTLAHALRPACLPIKKYALFAWVALALASSDTLNGSYFPTPICQSPPFGSKIHLRKPMKQAIPE
jgi:hypothetical protein